MSEEITFRNGVLNMPFACSDAEVEAITAFVDSVTLDERERVIGLIRDWRFDLRKPGGVIDQIVAMIVDSDCRCDDEYGRCANHVMADEVMRGGTE